MRIALCDFDERFISGLLSYLYGKCKRESFNSFTNIEDYKEALKVKSFDYTIMSDGFYSKTESAEVSKSGKMVVLSSSVEKLSDTETYKVIYKYGPMDGLCRMIENKDKKYSTSSKYAVFSPTHHELTEMYALSMCQMLSDNEKVLLIDTMHCPIVSKLIRDGPVASIIDVIYKLENDKADDIRELFYEYDNIDILPYAKSLTDISSITGNQWQKLLDYIDSLNYTAYVFALEDVSQGFRDIMEYIDTCVLINRKGDYYRERQDSMREFIRGLGVKTRNIELLMSANNLTEGCYQLEELLTGNLGKYVRSQHY